MRSASRTARLLVARRAQWAPTFVANRQSPIVVPLALLVALLLAACGGSATPTPTIEPGAILARAGARLDEVKTVHFTATIDGPAFIDATRTIQLRSANGDIVVPDQMQAKIQIAAASLNVDVSLVTIGPDKYQTDFFTGRWGPAQAGFDYSPTILFDKNQGLSSIVGKMRDIERLPDETIDGQAAYRLKGKVDRATIQPITSGTIEGDPVGTELWIAKDSANLLKLVLTEPPTPNKARPAIWTLMLDRYDQPVTIARPQ